jgi:uncharacterized iron-regulated protein
MAHRINELLLQPDRHERDQFLVIAGNGHVLYYCGVPERVVQANPGIDACVVISYKYNAGGGDAGDDRDVLLTTQYTDESDSHPNEKQTAVQRIIKEAFSFHHSPGDYVYMYYYGDTEDDRQQQQPQQ